MQSRGFRPIELIIAGFVGIIGLCYLIELFIAPPDWGQFFCHSVVPQLSGPDSVTLAVGIVGATVMPHAIYLHSALMPDRIPARTEADKRRRLIRYSNLEVLLALGLAGLGQHGDGRDGGYDVPRRAIPTSARSRPPTTRCCR